jgi:outer membrane protein OmpA-like peptidoglycan-associated protein
MLMALAIVSLALIQVDCATKKSVKKEVSRIDKEMGDVESSLEANETRLKEHDSKLGEHDTKITQLSRESQEALDRANSAEKLAKGKLLYEVTLTDDAVRFGFDRSDLTDSAREALENLITQLKAENRNVYIEIQGYTDAFGTDEYNMKLGEARAEAVRRYLAENGVPLHRISTISYGESRPVADNRTKAGRSKNRRVVVLVLE